MLGQHWRIPKNPNAAAEVLIAELGSKIALARWLSLVQKAADR